VCPTRFVALLAALVTIASALVVVVAAPSSPADAATITVGPIQAQMVDHRGVNNGTNGNCITYAPATGPGSSATSSALVSSGGEAQTAHGYKNNCPNNLSTTNQSAIGFRPSAVPPVQDGTPFLIGRMIHYNNPITANDEYFTGTIRAVLGGFSAPNTLNFPWQLDETPNTGGGCCNDLLTFTNQISDVLLTQGGLQFRLVMKGFIQVDDAATCPAAPTGTPVNEFSTVEGEQTHACLYAVVVQVRSLTVVKTVASGPARTFGFTSSSGLAGSPWTNGSFSLAGGGVKTAELTSGDTVTVTETDPSDDRWALTNLTCTQIGANGQPQSVPGATLNPAARQVTLANVPPPPNLTQPGITCTFTNTYTPKTTLTLVKFVQPPGTAAANLWTLTATGSAAPPPAGFQISGPSGSAAVTSQRVPSGTYALTETGTGAAETGYVQVGDWSCRTAGNTTVPVTGGSVTLSDHATSANGTAAVTCTVTNRLATGSLRIAKVVDDPLGGYTGGTTKTFAGTYDCGTGASGSFSTLTTAVPVTISGIPAGRTCTVTETPPTGGLLNASFAWGTATYSEQPVTITDGATASVTITNHVEQRSGTFSLTKVVNGPGGFVGGTERVFPVSYTCTLANGPTTSGSLDVTLAGPVSPAASIPRGSVCTFTEALTTQPGDFSDASYAWTGSSFSPASVTIGDNTTAAVTVTNTYVRELGSLVIAKIVQGDGYLGGGGANFTVAYDCGTGFTGSVTIAAGGSATINNLPARIACTVQEVPPAANLLAPGFIWGTPTWSPGPVGIPPANGSTTLTVTNPTIPIFGQLRVTKAATGETQGIVAGTTFHVVAACSNGATFPFDLGVAETGSTPDIPVGTSCTITETPPSGGLLDSSFAWGPTPGPQVVTITQSGQVIPVTMTNTVVRVTGQLSITKAPITPAGIVDPARTFSIGFSCVYNGDAPVTGTVTLTAGQTATTPPVFLGSLCTVTEDPAELTVPPSATDPSWVWLPVTYDPSQQVVVTSATTPVTMSVINTIRQITGAFNITKAVVGSGKDGGYVPGSQFSFHIACSNGFSADFSLGDGVSFPGGQLPQFTTCTLTENGAPPTTGPGYGWDPVQFTVDGVASGTGNSVTFQIPAVGPVQVNALNPITPRLGSVVVAKQVTGATAGLAPGATFTINLACGPGLSYQLDVPANGSATQDGIPVGSVCTATESTPTGGLVDASFAWGPPTFDPATVTVALGTPVTITVTNPIERVVAPVELVKTYSGPQGVVDPAQTFPIHWSCTYNGTVVASGDEAITADPNGITVADDVPVTSVCTATEGGLPTFDDPAFRWEAPVITGTTVALPGPNTITVANTLVRDNGRVLVRKFVTGATEGYLGTGEDFTLHGQCGVPDHPEIPVRTRDGTIANGAQVLIEPVSIGWTCFGYEDTPSQDLLRDASYAWGPAIITPPGDFVLSRQNPELVFTAQNPIVRVTSSFDIEKDVVDPSGVVTAAATFTGTYSCVNGNDPPIEGAWSITPATNDTFTVPDVLLDMTCTVTEDDPGTTGLPDASWTWGAPVVGAPVKVVPGGTATVTVTNTIERLWAGLEMQKSVVGATQGVLPGAQFGGVWECVQGDTTYSDRFTVAEGVTGLFTPADERVPATAVCEITEDTPIQAALVDGSFAWDVPIYDPENVALVSGETARLGVTNTVKRVYSDITISKVVTGPAAGQVPGDREFSGEVTCRYGDDPEIVTTWAATTATPRLHQSILVGSVCSATEDPPGAGGQPVEGDPSYIWKQPTVSAPVTVLPPDQQPAAITVTNPTDRLFGTFTVSKVITGATEGIVDPSQPFHMDWSCRAGNGDTFAGSLEVPANQARDVGPEAQIPTGSTCTLTEPSDTMPSLIDGAWSWADPTFTVNGVAPVPPNEVSGRTLTFQIPPPQEDVPDPHVAVGVTNEVLRSFGTWSVAKSSDPPTGTMVSPGALVTYSVTVDSTGDVPVHDVVVTDDLLAVLPFATVVDGSVAAPAGTTASVDAPGQRLVWTVGTLAPDTTSTLTYQVRVNDTAKGVVVRNTVVGGGDVPPTACAQPAPDGPPCATSHETAGPPTIAKRVSSPPTRNADGTYTLAYDVDVTNTSAVMTTYTLTDQFAFAAGVVVRGVQVSNVTPGDVALAAGFDGAAQPVVATSTIAAGATHTFRITVTADTTGVSTVTALDCTLDPGETGTGFLNRATVNPTAEACAPIPDLADISVTKVVDRTEVVIDSAGSSRTRLGYTILVRNAGPGTARDVVVADTLPGGVVPLPFTWPGGECSRSGAVVTCPVGTLAPGVSVRIVGAIELLSTQPAGDVRNSVAVLSSTPDPDPSNQRASAVTRVTMSAAVAITGAQVAGIALAGLGVLGLGLGLLLVARRRRTA
jgi:uncharacterized repeat protein (TIGR01451 family)